jgi:hypothetical protein
MAGGKNMTTRIVIAGFGAIGTKQSLCQEVEI